MPVSPTTSAREPGGGPAPAKTGLGVLAWVIVLFVGVAGGVIAVGGYLLFDTATEVAEDPPTVSGSTKAGSRPAVTTPDGAGGRTGGRIPIPEWVELYPGASAPAIAADMSTDLDARTETFQVRTEDTPEQVIAYYQERLEEQAFVVEVTRTPAFSMLDATSADPWRRLSLLMAVGDDEVTRLVFQCQEK